MKVDQLGRTIELLRQRLMSELNEYNSAVAKGISTADAEPLYLKIKETMERIQSFNKIYQEELNKGLEHFNRFHPEDQNLE